MVQPATDIWAQWLLHRRHGGDAKRLRATLDMLYPIRDRVLDHAALRDGDTLLDIGCGDGLIAFGALEKSPASRIIFSDISQDLLDHARSLAHQTRDSDRCEFVLSPADDLSFFRDASVNAIAIRSVLIYVDAKQRAFNEFYRVLAPGGRLSIFEPINRFSASRPPHRFSPLGLDVTPVMELAAKVADVYRRLQPLDTDPMLNFDERDLIAFAERAGFKEVHLELEADLQPLGGDMSWDAFFRDAPNPKVPTLEEAMAQALTPTEVAKFVAHLRPLLESKQGIGRAAQAYLWASK